MEANIGKIQAFVLGARTGSFTEAANLMGVTQPSVSRMISSLEDEWELTLFNRHGSYVTLTEDGEAALPFAVQLCTSYQQLNNHISSISGLRYGVLRLAVPSSVATHLLPKPLKHFMHDYPFVRVEINEVTYAKAAELLESDQVEIAFLPEREHDTHYVSTHFESDEYVIVARKGHFPASPACLPLSSLTHERFIVDTETAPLLQKELTHLVQKFQTSNFQSILAMVEAGIGISLMPQLAIGKLDPALEIRHLQDPARRTMYVVHRSEAELSCAARTFLSYLKTTP